MTAPHLHGLTYGQIRERLAARVADDRLRQHFGYGDLGERILAEHTAADERVGSPCTAVECRERSELWPCGMVASVLAFD